MLFSTSTIPTLRRVGLSDDEQRLLQRLSAEYRRTSRVMALDDCYYRGEQIIKNLRLAVPAELEQHLRTVVGWGASAVDPYVERLAVDCFRRADGTDGDAYLMELMEDAGYFAQESMAFTDALSMGPAYWMGGSSREPGGRPVLTAESPLNVQVMWDLRWGTPSAAKMEYTEPGEERRRAALLVPNQTVLLGQEAGGAWTVIGRDEHDFGFVPLVRMANQPRTRNPEGRSQITTALKSIIDDACRTLLGLGVAREIYSAPGKAILGADENSFKRADGSDASALETYITKVLALERDENGDLPEIHQFNAYDPSVFTKVLDWYASQAAGIVAATPEDLGLYNQGNPASAEAGLIAEDRRNRRSKRIQRDFTRPLTEVARMLVRFDNDGELPEEYRRLTADWAPVEMEAPALWSDAISKQVAAGVVPATSDVVLKRLGYSAIDRVRLQQDRAADDARNLAQALAAGMLPNQGAASGSASGV